MRIKKTPFLFIWIIGLCILPGFSQAQMLRDIFPLNREFHKSGFFASPLLTYNFPLGENSESFTNNDTLYEYTALGKGSPAFGIELGYFRSFKNPYFFHWLEGSIAYRQFKGSEEHQGTLSINNAQTEFQSDNEFTYSWATANVRAVHFKQLGKFTFLTAAFGLNVDYLVNQKVNRSSTYPNSFEKFPEDLHLDGHFNLGIGLRLSETLLFIPAVEIPVLRAFPVDRIEPRFASFGSLHQEVMISFRFMLLRKDWENCNAPVFEGFPQ